LYKCFIPRKTLDKTKINPYHVQIYRTFYNLPCATNISQLVFIVENKKKKRNRNLEKNKVIYFTLVQHSSPLPARALSLPPSSASRKPPPPIRLQISARCFLFYHAFVFKIYGCFHLFYCNYYSETEILF